MRRESRDKRLNFTPAASGAPDDLWRKRLVSAHLGAPNLNEQWSKNSGASSALAAKPPEFRLKIRAELRREVRRIPEGILLR